MLKAINILGVLALFLLLRKLIWCLRLSHRYLMPEIAVATATSQHSQ